MRMARKEKMKKQESDPSITPSYSGPGREVFSSTRTGFDDIGIDCRAMFLMRDRLKRCIGSLAMHMTRKEKKNKQGSDPRDDLLVFSTSENCMLRTRYDRTIGELSAGFGRNDIYFGIFEEMFLPKNIEQISRFIGISAKPELSKVKVNSATASVAISEDSRAAVAEHYREVYEYMADFMPQTRELWGGFKYL